jgi:hypothetical protein
MKLEQYIKAIDYKIGEGSKYTWYSFGDNARYLDFDNDCDSAGCFITGIFDQKTQQVYSVEFHNYDTNVAYRWIDPNFKESYQKEQSEKGFSDETEYESFKIVNIEVEDDILEKIEYFLLSGSYDTRIKVPLDLDDELLFDLMKMAHEKDITLNQLIGNVIEQSIEKYERNHE